MKLGFCRGCNFKIAAKRTFGTTFYCSKECTHMDVTYYTHARHAHLQNSLCPLLKEASMNINEPKKFYDGCEITENPQRLKVFYDAEFTGLHRNTTLISIGLLSMTGAFFYAEFNDYDRSQVDNWLQQNVIDNLIFKDKDQNTVDNLIFDFTSTTTGKKHQIVMMCDDTDHIRRQLQCWLKNEAMVTDQQIQFYTDCYAYDWVLFNDLICDDGKALHLPDYLYYIPMDLSTALQIKDEDPDVTREDFVYPDMLEQLKSCYPFNKWGEKYKHNSLWDAMVCYLCFYKLFNPNRNRRVYDPSLLDKYPFGNTEGYASKGNADHPTN